MDQPHLAVVQTDVEILAAAPNLTNSAAGQGYGEVRSQRSAQARLTYLDRGNGLTDDQPLKTAPNGFHFRQFRHISLPGLPTSLTGSMKPSSLKSGLKGNLTSWREAHAARRAFTTSFVPTSPS